MARLPTPGQDAGTWGSVLNEFLSVAHNVDGSIKDQPINVKNFGAKGDGATDDTAAIHAARDVAGIGGIIYFPKGIYLCKNIQLSLNNQTLQLHPQATIKLKSDATASDYLLRVTATSGVTIDGGNWDFNSFTANRTWMIFTSSCNKITFRNMVIIGPTANAGSWYALGTSNVSDVTIEKCRITSRGYTCIRIHNETSNTTLSNIRITDNICDFSSAITNMSGGIAIWSTAGDTSRFTRVTVSRNQILGPALTTNNENGGITMAHCDDSVCANNIVDGACFGFSIPSDRIVIMGNTIKRFSAIGIEAIGDSISIIGNTIDGSIGRGDGIQGSGRACIGYNITGNIFKGFTSSLAMQRCIFLTVRNQPGDASWESVNISANIFKTTGMTYAWQMNAPVINATFSANTVDMRNGTNSRGLVFSIGSIAGLSVTANSFTNMRDVLYFSYNASGITLDGISVVGNALKNVTNLRTSSLSGGASYGSNVHYAANNDSTRDCIVTRYKDGIPNDNDFDAPKNGMMVIDSTNNKLWVRIGGVWKSVAVS